MERTFPEIERRTAAAERHDADEPDRLRRWRVLEPDAGRFLWFVVQTVQARDVVEIGTSRGVSTLWLADALQASDGHLVSVDVDAEAHESTQSGLTAVGLAERVTLRCDDGGRFLAQLPDASIDLLFLDAERTEYQKWWPHPVRVLRPGGVLVADNALSHPDEIAALRDLLAEDERMTATTVLGVGKGELISLRHRGQEVLS